MAVEFVPAELFHEKMMEHYKKVEATKMAKPWFKNVIAEVISIIKNAGVNGKKILRITITLQSIM